MTRRALQPLDITLRHGRRYQVIRKLFLGFSVALTFGLPLWHLHALDVEGAGIAADSRWAHLAARLPDSPPPFYGAPTSVWVGVLELVDPLESLAVALFHGLSWNWVWTVLPGVVLVVLLGRFFCGWACPYLPVLAAANAARWVLTRLGVPLKDVKVPRSTSRVVMVGALVVGALAGTQLVPLIYPPAIIGREVFRAVFYGSLGAGALVVAGAFLFDTFVSRAGFCRSLCPGGAMFSVLANLSPIRVHNERSKCTDCTVCDVICNLGQSPMTNTLDSGCERCGKCIASCPTQALSWTLAAPPLVQLVKLRVEGVEAKTAEAKSQ
ncbi:MAG: 4Fe-4S binding protein [Myxococcales bacterium]|nr:4Fe-4S binding protein [Myxococcales bacterium]